jgi:hypothetical protein
VEVLYFWHGTRSFPACFEQNNIGLSRNSLRNTCSRWAVPTPRKGKEMEILFALVFMVRFGVVLVKIHASLVVGGQGDGEQIRFHRIQIRYLYVEMAFCSEKASLAHFYVTSRLWLRK